MNSIIETYKTYVLGISSIGLDGELIDNVTSLPKPRIFVYEEMIVATAEECLKMTEAKYTILRNTGVYTALGEIVIIKITSSGFVLVGGPSVVTQMETLIDVFKSMNIAKILIDGAFSRRTVSKSTDACIFAVGAAYSTDMTKVVEAAKLSLYQFSLPKIPDEYKYLDGIEHITLIDKNSHRTVLSYNSVIQYQNEVCDLLSDEVDYLYLPGSLTSSFLKELLTNRKLNQLRIIIKSPTHMVLPESMLRHIQNSKIKVYVINPINLVSIMYNPYSPTGHYFDDIIFNQELSKITNLPIINVMNERRNDNDD